MNAKKTARIELVYECSPRDRAAVGYAHTDTTGYWADNEEFSGDRADEIIAAIKSGEIWSDIELPAGWNMLEDENEIDEKGEFTAWVTAYDQNDEDVEPIARTAKVFYEE